MLIVDELRDRAGVDQLGPATAGAETVVYRYDSMRVDGFRVEVTAPRAPV